MNPLSSPTPFPIFTSIDPQPSSIPNGGVVTEALRRLISEHALSVERESRIDGPATEKNE